MAQPPQNIHNVRMQCFQEAAMTSIRDHDAAPTLLRSESFRGRHVLPGTPLSNATVAGAEVKRKRR